MSQQNNLDNELDNFDIFNPSPENIESEEIENEPSEVASQDGSELTNKDRVTAFFLQPEVKSQVDLISRSSLATYLQESKIKLSPCYKYSKCFSGQESERSSRWV